MSILKTIELYKLKWVCCIVCEFYVSKAIFKRKKREGGKKEREREKGRKGGKTERREGGRTARQIPGEGKATVLIERPPENPNKPHVFLAKNLSYFICRFGVCVVCCFETGSCYVSQAGIKKFILLPQPPEYWDSRCAPAHLAKKSMLMVIFSW
jgi:hypothetical protein